MLKLFRNAAFLEVRTRMEPRFCQYGRHVRGSVYVVAGGEIVACAQGSKFLGIPLVHAAKAAELPLDTIIEPVMIGIPGNKAVPADAIVSLHALHGVDRKWQARHPRLPRGFVW